MMAVHTPTMISPECSFKSNQRQVKIRILTPLLYDVCAVCLYGMLHTTESVYALGCISQRFVCVELLTLRCAAHRGDCLYGVLHTAEKKMPKNIVTLPLVA